MLNKRSILAYGSIIVVGLIIIVPSLYFSLRHSHKNPNSAPTYRVDPNIAGLTFANEYNGAAAASGRSDRIISITCSNNPNGTNPTQLECVLQLDSPLNHAYECFLLGLTWDGNPATPVKETSHSVCPAP